MPVQGWEIWRFQNPEKEGGHFLMGEVDANVWKLAVFLMSREKSSEVI